MSEKDLRTKLRSKTLGAQTKFQSETVTIDGEDFEVRQPSVSGKGKIMQKCKIPVKDLPKKGKKEEVDDSKVASIMMQKVNMADMKIWATIFCTYVPDTSTRVFEESDFKQLAGMPAGSWVDDLGSVAMRLMNVKPKEDAKN